MTDTISLKPLTPLGAVEQMLEEARRAGIGDLDWVEVIDELKRVCVCHGLESDRTF